MWTVHICSAMCESGRYDSETSSVGPPADVEQRAATVHARLRATASRPSAARSCPTCRSASRGRPARSRRGARRARRRSTRVGLREEVVPRQHVVAGRRSRRASSRSTCSSGSCVALRLDLRELLGVLDEHDPRLAVMDDVLDLVGRARRVDAGRRAARHHRGVIEDHPLGPVEAEDRDLAAARAGRARSARARAVRT